MYRIEYEIGLNEEGRPYIGLPDNYEQRPEDRFFALEIARYILGDLLVRRTPELDEETVDAMVNAEALLGQLGDNVAEILYGVMRNMGETHLLVGAPYHIGLKKYEELEALPDKDILYDGRIYDRVEGLRVRITNYDEPSYVPSYDVYELIDGITNEHWVKLQKDD